MNRAVLFFVSVAYALAVALSLVVGLTGGHHSRFVGLGFGAMLIPAIATLVVWFAMNEGVRRIGWERFPLRYLPVALLLIPVVMHAAMLPTTAALAGGLPWQDWLTPGSDGLYHTPATRGWGALTTQGLVGRVAINAVVGLILTSLLALFEEVGWRAWMLPRLVDRMGRRRALVIGAVIWGLWHAPFALSGIQHIDRVPPARLALIVPLGSIVAGLIIGWLWLRTESIWMVALAHGALNNWGQYAFKYMEDPAVDWVTVLGAGGLALFVVGTLLVAFALPPASPRLQYRAVTP